MRTTIITPVQFEEYLQEFVGKKIDKFYYITDTIVVFKSGRKFEDDGMERYEYELRINGNWEYFRDGEVVETTIPKENEGGANFRTRIGNLIGTINPKQIKRLIVDTDGKMATVTLNDDSGFVVRPIEEGFIGYSHYYFNKQDQVEKAIHVRLESEGENKGKLILIEASRP